MTRKTIYVSDEEAWDRFVIKANEQGKTISDLIMDSDRLDRIESKIDTLIKLSVPSTE